MTQHDVRQPHPGRWDELSSTDAAGWRRRPIPSQTPGVSSIPTDSAVQVVKAGGEVRLQVQDPQLGSGSSWKVMTHRTTGDVYVAHREGGKWLKTSFHASGQSHFKLTPEPPKSPLYLAVNRDHDNAERTGWRHAMRIVVPRSELRVHTENVRKHKTIALAIPDGWDALSLDVLLTGPSRCRAVRCLPPARVAAYLDRGDGGAVALLTRPCNLSGAFVAQIAATRREFTGRPEWTGQQTRIVLFGVDEALGAKQQVEIAVDGTQDRR